MNQPPIIHRLPVGSFKVNCYLVVCPATGEAAIIDAGGEPEKILDLVRAAGIRPVLLLNTHAHGDHGLANPALRKGLGIPLALHEADADFFAIPANRAAHRQELGLVPCDPPDRRLRGGEQLKIGNLSLEVIHTPGHSPGSVCFYAPGQLLTGDTLFVGDVGRTDLTGGSFEQLLASLRDRILPLPEATVINPGHDYGETPTSTLAWEKGENPYITDFILG